jgi:hypothetical protein
MQSGVHERNIGGEVGIEKKSHALKSAKEADLREEPPMEAEIVDKTVGYTPRAWEIYASAVLILLGALLMFVMILSAIQGWRDWQTTEIPDPKIAEYGKSMEIPKVE